MTAADPADAGPGPSIADALRPHVERVLAAKAGHVVREAVAEAFGEAVSEGIEAVELLSDFEGDVARGLRELLTEDAFEDAVTGAIADYLFPPEPPEPELCFPNLGVFVEQYVVRVYRRDVQGNSHIWCPRWFEHEPAVVALQVLWTAFETYRRDPGTGPLVFHRDGFLPIMNVLTHPEGPLRGCSDLKGHHKPLPPLRCEPIPEGLFEPTPAEVGGMPTAPPAPLPPAPDHTR